MGAMAVFVKSGDRKACIRLPAGLIFEGVAELKRLASLDEPFETRSAS
jgi:hypothetical protein